MDSWLRVQAAWLYLEPIFGSQDIRNQIPREGALFEQVDERWSVLLRTRIQGPAVQNLLPCFVCINSSLQLLARYLVSRSSAVVNQPNSAHRTTTTQSPVPIVLGWCLAKSRWRLRLSANRTAPQIKRFLLGTRRKSIMKNAAVDTNALVVMSQPEMLEKLQFSEVKFRVVTVGERASRVSYE